MPSSVWDYDCAVVGAGPGGLVTTLYLRRFRRSVALINAGKPRAAWIPRTHNLLGFPAGITGRGLLRRLNRQVADLRADRIEGEAVIRRYKDGFEARVGPNRLLARTVVLATGIEDVQPEVKNLEELRNEGLLRYCSICDAYDFREHVIGVIAADDDGIQKALFIAFFTHQLRIIIPTAMKLSPRQIHAIRQARARVVQGDILGMESCRNPRGLMIHLTGRKRVFCRVAYVALGARVRDSAFRGISGLFRTKAGYLTTTSEQRLPVRGLFAVGDCVNQVGQISIAAGQAAVAATTIHNDLLD